MNEKHLSDNAKIVLKKRYLLPEPIEDLSFKEPKVLLNRIYNSAHPGYGCVRTLAISKRRGDEERLMILACGCAYEMRKWVDIDWFLANYVPIQQ